MFREMEYVYAVYLERSFTRAAENMHLSQSALSAMVKKAEKKIGSSIFDRSTSPLRLTQTGEFYIEQTERIMKIHQESREYFSRVMHSRNNNLRIGGAAIYQAYIFPSIIASFLEEYPDVNISWTEARSELVQKLLMNEIDIFPEVNNYFSKDVDGSSWCHEELVLVLPDDLPINEGLEEYRYTPGEIRGGLHRSKEAKPVDLSLFREMRFVLMSEENDTFQRSFAICQNAGFTPNAVTMKPAQMLTAYQLAGQIKAATFVSDTLIAHTDKNYRYYLYKLKDDLAQREQYLYFSRGRELNKATRLFLDYMREHSRT